MRDERVGEESVVEERGWDSRRQQGRDKWEVEGWGKQARDKERIGIFPANL